MLALGADLRSWGFSSTARLESYSRWLAQQDLGPSYREYRRVLALLDDHDGRRFVLKSPAHLAEPGALVDTFPGGGRQPAPGRRRDRRIGGVAVLGVSRSTYSDEVDPFDVGGSRPTRPSCGCGAPSSTAPHTTRRPRRFVDLAYRDLVASPVEAAPSTGPRDGSARRPPRGSSRRTTGVAAQRARRPPAREGLRAGSRRAPGALRRPGSGRQLRTGRHRPTIGPRCRAQASTASHTSRAPTTTTISGTLGRIKVSRSTSSVRRRRNSGFTSRPGGEPRHEAQHRQVDRRRRDRERP